MNAINNFMDSYDYWMVSTFGYDLAVKIEDVAYGLSMFFLGMVVMAFFTGIFIRHLRSLKDFGDSQVQLLRIDNGKKSIQRIQIRNLMEAFEQVLLLSFSPIFTFKRFTKRDERRTRRFVRIMFVVAVVTIIWGMFTTFTVLRPI